MSASQKRGGKPQKEYFLDEDHDLYQDNPLVSIDPKFEGNGADIENFHRLYSYIVRNQLNSFTVGKAFKAAY